MTILSFARTTVRKINDFFIFMVLATFYLSIIGITALIFVITTKIIKRNNKRSYWQNVDEKKFTVDYFKSPY